MHYCLTKPSQKRQWTEGRVMWWLCERVGSIPINGNERKAEKEEAKGGSEWELGPPGHLWNHQNEKKKMSFQWKKRWEMNFSRRIKWAFIDSQINCRGLEFNNGCSLRGCCARGTKPLATSGGDEEQDGRARSSRTDFRSTRMQNLLWQVPKASPKLILSKLSCYWR